jgi:thiol-disulfide isomerase/thioredoxin
MNKLLSALFGVALVLATAVAAAQPTSNPMIAKHAGDLVVLRGDELVVFDATRLAQAPYTILYFGAGWCPDCRRFSPNLVAAYDGQPAGAHRFEVLLLSRDKSAESMLQFMRSEKMKWPALAFDKIPSAQDLQSYYSGHGIPCLTVIDAAGTIVLQSKDDQDANEVLQALQNLLKTKKDR